MPLYFAGARLEFFFGGAAVVDGMGLLQGVTSYCGEVVLSVVSDRQIMPDPATDADCLDESCDDLRKAVPKRAARALGPRTRSRRGFVRAAAG